MATKLEKASPINSSFGTPNNSNPSGDFQFLKPENCTKFCSPFMRNQLASPNFSPIVKSAGSETSFLKKRDMKNRNKASKRRISSICPMTAKQIMESTLSVKTVLKDLRLIKYFEIFEREEINLAAFFTLNDDDLKTIGIEDALDRQKILDLINDFNTPKKTRKCESRNYLHRY